MNDMLTEAELRAMDITVELVNVMCKEVIGRGPTREQDVREFVAHVHVIQQAILSQAAGRALPQHVSHVGRSGRALLIPPQQKDNQMNNQRALATIGVATMIALAVPGIAAAHNASATPSCSGLSWSAVNYNKDVANTIVVKVDGATVYQDLDFKSSDEGSTPWSQTSSHTWSVVINAPGTQYDRNFGGTWQPCQTTTTVATTVPPTSTTVVVATSVPDATTTVVTDPTTTSVVEVCCVVVPSTAPPSSVADVSTLTPVEPVLPRTGLDAGDLVGIAVCLTLCGGFLLYVRRVTPR